MDLVVFFFEVEPDEIIKVELSRLGLRPRLLCFTDPFGMGAGLLRHQGQGDGAEDGPNFPSNVVPAFASMSCFW